MRVRWGAFAVVSALAVASCATVLGLDDVQYGSAGGTDAAAEAAQLGDGAPIDSGSTNDAGIPEAGLRCSAYADAATPPLFCADFDEDPLRFFQRGTASAFPRPATGTLAPFPLGAGRAATFTSPARSEATSELGDDNASSRHVRWTMRVRREPGVWGSGAINVFRLHLDRSQSCYTSADFQPAQPRKGQLNFYCGPNIDQEVPFDFPAEGEWHAWQVDYQLALGVPLVATVRLQIDGLLAATAQVNPLTTSRDHVLARVGPVDLGDAEASISYDDILVEELP